MTNPTGLTHVSTATWIGMLKAGSDDGFALCSLSSFSGLAWTYSYDTGKVLGDSGIHARSPKAEA